MVSGFSDSGHQRGAVPSRVVFQSNRSAFVPNRLFSAGRLCTNLRMLLLLNLLLSAVGSASLGTQSAAWPAARARHHMVHAPATKEVLLLGGAQPRRDVGTDPDAAIWIWNGQKWRTHPSTLPPRANEAVAYDPERNRLVVHGGSDLPDQTWEWDHQVWRPMSGSGPGARGHHAMSYDAVRKQMVLFGNNDRTPSTDTWGWNGQSWTRLASDGPPARGVYGIAFDGKRGVVVLFGGCCAEGVGLAGDRSTIRASRRSFFSAAATQPRTSMTSGRSMARGSK